MKSLGLVGFGVSNKAVFEHFKDKYEIFVHNESSIPLPNGAYGIFGEDYLSCTEDLVFRSPGVRPDRIKARGRVICESDYALGLLKCKKILVSGSDGKTTTASMIHSILKREYSSYLGGNIGSPILNAVHSPPDFLVGELSSFQLIDSYPVSDTAVLTGITENHLNWHRDMDEYVLSKVNLLKNAGRIVLCYDCPTLRKIGEQYHNVSYFSLNDISHIKGSAYIKDGFFYLDGKRLFGLSVLKLRGYFNILNALASILATYPYVSTLSQRLALEEFTGVGHRMELACRIKDVEFINSSIDSTPSRTVATLSAFDTKKCILILGGTDKGLSYDILREAVKSVKAILILGENKDKILNALSSLSNKIYTINNLTEAVPLAYKMASRGDIVLLSPASCSFDSYGSYVERGNHFKSLALALGDSV